jgi:hypothetical protein
MPEWKQLSFTKFRTMQLSSIKDIQVALQKSEMTKNNIQ